MKNHSWLMGTLASLFWGTLGAQQLYIQPTPQSCVEASDSVFLSVDFHLEVAPSLAGTPTEKLLRSIASPVTDGNKLIVKVGLKSDKNMKKYAVKVPQVAEGYFLTVEKKAVVIVGSDERGAYYGVQTFAQLFKIMVAGMQTTHYSGKLWHLMRVVNQQVKSKKQLTKHSVVLTHLKKNLQQLQLAVSVQVGHG